MTDLEHKLINEILPALRQEVFALNDFMAQNPEIGDEEFESSKHIVDLLRSHGIETEYPFCGLPTSFKGVINPGKQPRACLVAEYDALPGLGHACGHCGSGSSSVLAALALNAVKDELPFGVDIIGTPNEEGVGRKEHLVQAHEFDGYAFAAMVHMNHENHSHPRFLALDAYVFEFFGKPAHAAAEPWAGNNAFNASRLFFDAVDMMRQHISPEARVHGVITDAGKAPNIIPDYVRIEFLTRAPARAELDPITDWVKDIARAAALATHTECKISLYGPPFHDLYVSPAGLALCSEIFEDMGLDYTSEARNGGSSDIGNIDYVIPAFHPYMSIGHPYTVHTQEFADSMTSDGAHTAIANSGEYLTRLCLKLCLDPERLAVIKAQHDAYRFGVKPE